MVSRKPIVNVAGIRQEMPAGDAVKVSSGGTGLTNYTIGDLIVADGPESLVRLPDIAVGNVLLSGGVGVVPAYGKVALTSHVSGILPKANGGAGGLTNGSIPYLASTILDDSPITYNGSSIVSIYTNKQQFQSNGIVNIGNSTATAGGVADQVRFHAEDFASGDSRLRIQSELGGAIWIGNNRLRSPNVEATTKLTTPLIDSSAAIALTPAAGLNVNVTATGGGTGLNVTSVDGVGVLATSSNAIAVVGNSTGIAASGLFYRNFATASNPVLHAQQFSTSDTSPALRVDQWGTGDILALHNSSTKLVSVSNTGALTASTIYGSSSSGGNLQLHSTSHATKGNILFGTGGAYDATNQRLGIGTTSPNTKLDVNGTVTTPKILGGTGTTQSLTYQTTSGVGATGARHIFLVGNNGATEAMTILNNGNVGMGTASPSVTLHVVGNQSRFERFADPAPNCFNFVAQRGRGTEGAPTAVQSGDQLFQFLGNGYGSTSMSSGGLARFRFAASESWTDSAQGTEISFWTTLNGTTTTTQNMTLSNAGSLGIRTTEPTAPLDVNGDRIRIRTAFTPASASATGNAGAVAWDANYVYICIATNTWRRVAHASW